MTFRPCAIVPSRNHYLAIGEVVAGLRASGLPVFVIDDASDEPARAVLAALHRPEDGVTVHRCDIRQGKGGAVLKGVDLALTAGFSHALQIDADGQHDLGSLGSLLDAAIAHPNAVIAGRATYDGTAPLGRRIGRWITHAWVWVETLSFRISDSMCGFRVYPLDVVAELVRTEPITRFMDFDTDILVRLTWRGVPTVMVPVRVIYPEGNTSNFAMFRDNWRITRMHTRLVLTMLWRLPSILANRPPALEKSSHWAALGERGGTLGLRTLAAIFRLSSRSLGRVAMAPVVLYFYLSHGERRRQSRRYLDRCFALDGRRYRFLDGLRHHFAFAEKMLDSFEVWASGRMKGELRYQDRAGLDRALAADGGALVLVSHLGNMDLARGMLDPERRARLTVVVHSRHAQRYVRFMAGANGEAVLNTIEVDDFGPETALLLESRIARGDWVVIAADRTPPVPNGRVVPAPFLGQPAPFPTGPYVLAHLLRCPVHLLFCLRESGGHRLYFEAFAERIMLPRAGREAALRDLAARYAGRLEMLCRRHPFQWYNFFDFWAQRPEAG